MDSENEVIVSNEELQHGNDVTDDMNTVAAVLNTAKTVAVQDGKTVDLTIEAVYWALKSMKEDPTLSIGNAMLLGLAEWDK